jgi:bifunctional non-homologous end joining protein LigD
LDQLVEVDGRQLKISNLEKILYPEAHFTKGEVVDYYVRVAPFMLPHLSGRPLTMVRFPDGVEAGSFFMKQCPSYKPDWLHTGRGDLGETEHCVVDDLASLIWVVNLASLELHTPMARSSDIDTPTMVVFDLDPGAPADIVDCCRVALEIRELLGTLGLGAFPKTSGSKGLQLYVPLNTTPVGHDETKGFARAVAQLLERRDPKRITSVMRKDLRGGKVFVDWDQNTRHKTTISPYSMRARPRPWVSTPLAWGEVEECLSSGDSSALTFETADVLVRVAEHGDLFAPTVELEQALPKLAS